MTNKVLSVVSLANQALYDERKYFSTKGDCAKFIMGALLYFAYSARSLLATKKRMAISIS